MHPMISEKLAQSVIDCIRQRLQQYFARHGLGYAVFGKSEGLDSSVIAGLLSDLPGIQPLAVIMPIESRPEVSEIAHEVLEHFSIPALELDMHPSYDILRSQYDGSSGLLNQLQQLPGISDQVDLIRRKAIADGNIKARLRMITLYHLAQLVGGAVISTDNYSEYWMGFWTLCGDVGDIAPIQQIFKGEELYTIAKVLGVPKRSLEAPPSDGLGITTNSYDEEQLGLPYPELDKVIIALLQADLENTPSENEERLYTQVAQQLALPLEKVRSTGERLKRTQFKRHWPVIFTREEIGLPPIELLS